MFESPYSSYVILAKARAMYGNSLKKKQYMELMNCHSVSEVTSYLKNNTSYASVLADMNESTIHRGHLEQLVRRKLYDDIASLGRYDLSTNKKLTGYLIKQAEIEQIISCLRFMNAGNASEFFFSMPLFFTSRTKLNVGKMSHCKTYEELLGLMKGTDYYEVMKKFPPADGGQIRLTEIETALFAQLTETADEWIRHSGGSVRREMEDIFGVQVDVQNVTRILRLKKFFGADPETIKKNLLPFKHAIPDKTMEAMINAPTAEDVMKLFWDTAVGRSVPENQRSFLHDLDDRTSYFNARRHIHYSIHPEIVMLSYLVLTEIEVDDIINIIEGVRYGMEPDEIKPMLVLANS